MISAIALDLGTTSIKAGLLDDDGTLHGSVSCPAPPITASDGRCESDALAYAEAAEQALTECLAHTAARPPLGLCSQRSSFLIWERASGNPVTPLISWQDTRGAQSCAELKNSEALIQAQTGLRLTPYYFAPKLRVVLREYPEWRARLERGDLMMGTLDTFLIWRRTNGAHHVTDASMAARTLLMDIRTGQWSPQLCALFGVPMSALPQILPSAALNLALDNGLVLRVGVGDQSAALIAGIGRERSHVLVNLGTGGFVMRYLAENENALTGYLRTLVYRDEHTHLAAEGTLNSLAAALAPYPVAECRLENLATDNIFCLAEPGGIGAPYFRSDLGLLFSESVEHLPPQRIATLLLEGIIFRVARILEDFHRASPIARVYLSGGLSGLPCLQQGIALCAPCDTYRLQQKDSSLQGAALLAAGMASSGNVNATCVTVAHANPALPEKFRHWKQWFDKLLRTARPSA